jgi:hypothetical protein
MLHFGFLPKLSTSAQAIKKHLNCQASAAMVISVVAVLVAATAFARVALNTIDPVAIVSDDGRHVIVTGPIACTKNERAYLLVTVSQRLTGAVAEGNTRITCTGNDQQWRVHAATQGKTSFEAGAATAVALARTTDRKDVTDAHQWLVNITLVED